MNVEHIHDSDDKMPCMSHIRVALDPAATTNDRVVGGTLSVGTAALRPTGAITAPVEGDVGRRRRAAPGSRSTAPSSSVRTRSPMR